MKEFLLHNDIAYVILKVLALIGCMTLIAFLGLMGVFGVVKGRIER